MIKKVFVLLLGLFLTSPLFAYQIYSASGVSDTAVLTTASGVPIASPFAVSPESTKATYHAVIADITPVATATDLLVISGSATKTIRVVKVQASANATGAGTLDFYVFKRTAANTGGTTAAVTPAQHDSADPAPTATVVRYTANATGLGAGTLVTADHYVMPPLLTPGFHSVPWMEVFGNKNDKGIVLRGTAQSLAFSLNGQTIPSGTSLYVVIEWTEE